MLLVTAIRRSHGNPAFADGTFTRWLMPALPGAHVAILAFSMTKRKLALAFTPAKERSPGEANFPAAGEESPTKRTATDPRP